MPSLPRLVGSSAFWLAVVCALFLAAQLVLFDLERPLDWDEAVYLSETYAGVEPVGYSAHRSRGIILLVAPIAVLGPPVWLVRLFLALGSGAAMFAALFTWRRALGAALPVAALLFGSSWLTLLYGSEISPNLWSALGAVAATGMMAEFFREPTRWRLAAFVVLLAAVGVIRPVDATVIGGATGVLVLAYRPTAWKAAALSVASAGLLGWLPWVAEAVIMWGGIRERLASAQSAFGEGVPGNIFMHHLRLTDGPLMGPDTTLDLPTAGVIWWFVLASLAAASVGVCRSGTERRGAVLAVATGGGAAAFYLLFPGALAPRFLLPAYALLSVAAALGMRAMTRRWSKPRQVALLAVIGAAALIPWQLWNVYTATQIETSQVEARSQGEILGTILRAQAAGGDCAFASQYGWPQIQFYSGCRGRRYVRGTEPPFNDADLASKFVVALIPPDDIALSSERWYGEEVQHPKLSGWFLYRPQDM